MSELIGGGVPLQDDSPEMQRVRAVHAEYAERLLKLPHVLGVGIGYATRNGVETGELALIVMVDSKLTPDDLDPEDLIPAQIEGVRVDVQEFGTFTAN